MLAEWMNSLLMWLGLGGLGLSALVGAAWFFGLMPVLGAVATVVAAIVAPIAGAMVQGLVWTWQNIFWPGLWDILEDWVTILTVLTLGCFLWFGLKAHYEIQEFKQERALSACFADLKKARRPLPKQVPQPQVGLPWPWK